MTDLYRIKPLAWRAVTPTGAEREFEADFGDGGYVVRLLEGVWYFQWWADWDNGEDYESDDCASGAAAMEAAWRHHCNKLAQHLEPVSEVVVSDEVVSKAMQDAWDEICDDTECHPLDITRNRRLLYFSPNHWADLTARRIRDAIAPFQQASTDA